MQLYSCLVIYGLCEHSDGIALDTLTLDPVYVFLIPRTFSSTGGVINLRCSSEDYFQLLLYHDYDLTLNIRSFTEKSLAENIFLTSRLSRDFILRLACFVIKRGDHREAAKVSHTFQSLLFLVSLHGQLDTREIPETAPHAFS